MWPWEAMLRYFSKLIEVSKGVAMPENESHHSASVTISVDGEDVEISSREVTGLEIKSAAGLGDDVELYGPGGNLVANTEMVRVHSGEAFSTTPRPIVILVNRKPVEVPSAHVTGLEIKNAAGVTAEFQLFGPKGESISDEEKVHVHKDEKFTAISGQDVS
jgi:hypothetical protein